VDQQRFLAVLSDRAEGQGGQQINLPGTARSLKKLLGQLERPGPCLPDPRGHETADAG